MNTMFNNNKIKLIDIHDHFLYGLDDGARSIEESIKLLRISEESGVEKIIFTPHYRLDLFEYDTATYDAHFKRIKDAVKSSNIKIEVFQGNEAYLDENVILAIKEGRCKTMAQSKYVLTEILRLDTVEIQKRILFDLLCEGYVPIIAHIERLINEKEDVELVMKLYRLGCLLQINAGALLNSRKLWKKRWLYQAIRENHIAFVATDSHRTDIRSPNLLNGYMKVAKKLGKVIADRVFYDNQLKVIKDETIDHESVYQK